MGLKERQQIEYLQREVLPTQNKQLREYTGSEALFEPDWSSFEKDLNACYSLERLLTSINNAFEWVARNPPGKAVLAQEIVKIVIQNSSDTSERRIGLENKVLTLTADIN
jgi:hypothetical protein